MIGLIFFLSWVNIGGVQASQSLLFIQMLVLLFLFDTLYTAIATSIYVMPFEMAISNKARGSIMIWKLIFAVFHWLYRWFCGDLSVQIQALLQAGFNGSCLVLAW
jgi:hypothetical protein